jgi:L-serine deaminase
MAIDLTPIVVAALDRVGTLSGRIGGVMNTVYSGVTDGSISADKAIQKIKIALKQIEKARKTEETVETVAETGEKLQVAFEAQDAAQKANPATGPPAIVAELLAELKSAIGNIKIMSMIVENEKEAQKIELEKAEKTADKIMDYVEERERGEI